MKLDKEQIVELLSTEKIADDKTGIYSINFNQLVEKLSFSESEKNSINKLYREGIDYNERSHLDRISYVLNNKIEVFSHDFWELLFFRKHSYHSQYKDKAWNEFNETYESIKDVRKRVKVLKSLNINAEQLENFVKQLTYVQDGYMDLWFSLKKKTKSSVLEEDMKQLVLTYGAIDPNEVQKAVMLSYFNQTSDLEDLYIKNKDTPYKREIENELLKFKKIEQDSGEIFEEWPYHSIVYRKKININNNALIYKLNRDQDTVKKIVKVINQYLTREVYDIKIESIENKYIYIIEGYSESNLLNKIETVKQVFNHLPELLIKNEYTHIWKDDIYINEEVAQFLNQYIKSADMYKNLNDKLPEQNKIEKKKKI